MTKKQQYWHHYLYITNPEEIEKHVKTTKFKSRGLKLHLTYFEHKENTVSYPNILVIPATGWYGMHFAEVCYHMHLKGYNVFIFDFQGHGDSEGERGDFTINELMENCNDAIKFIAENYSDRIGLVGASLGGMLAFYIGLSNNPYVKSIKCQNPAILTDQSFHKEILKLKRTRLLLPIVQLLARLFPKLKVPLYLYIDLKNMITSKEDESKLKAFQNDPDIVKEYTLRGILSQISTPPPAPINELKIPISFLVPKRDTITPVSYVKDLFMQLPDIKKGFIEIDYAHYGCVAEPDKITQIVHEWFEQTL